MKKFRNLWLLSGRILYYASWPALLTVFYFSKRTRILVVVDNEMLVTTGWMGSGKWVLPGGGLHRNEDPKMGAIRELKEETGIIANKKDLKLLLAKKVKTELAVTYFMHGFLLELEQKPKLTKQKIEILNLEWVDWQKVYNNTPRGHDTFELIDQWRTLS